MDRMQTFSCTSVHLYERLQRLGQGTYGVVYKARHKQTGKIVAMKKLLHNSEAAVSARGFPTTLLREIALLNLTRRSKHPNLIQLLDVAVGHKPENVFLVLEFCKHDFSQLLHQMSAPFSIGQLKRLLLQLLAAVAHLHESFIVHRDLKLSNLLMDEQGVLKLSDLGLATLFGTPLRPLTPNVVSLWYRAPELLLGEETYTPAIDLWAVGCVFAELLGRVPLFRGTSELGQLQSIVRVLGKPSEKEWTGVCELSGFGLLEGVEECMGLDLSEEFMQLSDQGMDLLLSFLQWDPKRRISAQDALQHPFFSEEPAPTPPEEMRVFIQDRTGVARRKRKEVDQSGLGV